MSWIILGDSVTGTAHRASGVACQDAFRAGTFGQEQEWLKIVVADGAGSASHAAIGAQIACTEFIQLVEALEPEMLCTKAGMMELFTTVRAAVVAAAANHKVAPRELACTILLAVIGPTTAALAQIGDGAIVVGCAQEYRVVFWPESNEYANATDFLTDAAFANALKFVTITEPIDAVAVFTDGLQRLALEFANRSAYPGFFQPLFEELRSAVNSELLMEPFHNFLDSERVNARTDDDKTLIIAVR